MTTADCGPRCTEPVSTSSAGSRRWTGKVDRSWSSWTAGAIRIPAPPEPRKKRLAAPRPSRSAIVARNRSPSATAPCWMRTKRASSKFNNVRACLRDGQPGGWRAEPPSWARRAVRARSVVDLEHVVPRVEVVAADRLVVLGQPVGQCAHDDAGDVTAEPRRDARQREVGDVDVLRLLAVGVQEP